MFFKPCRLALPGLALLFLSALAPQLSRAQLPYVQSFKNTTAPGLIISGVARLTAASPAIDSPGSGYLRLTDSINNQVGCVYAVDSFPSAFGITATFDFFTWKVGANGSNQADGFSFYLFDASVNTFRSGANGAGLGYAQRNNQPGVGKGYIGIGVDEFGNFSTNGEGKFGGTTAQVKSAVVIRGPGNGNSNSVDYPYITGVKTDATPHTTPFSGTVFNQRFPDSSSVNFRRLKVILKPGSSLGTATGYKVTVIVYKGAGAASTPVVPDTMINAYDYPYAAPGKLQFGLGASTGSVNSKHEIRNMRIEATNAAGLNAAILHNDSTGICQGTQAILDITTNDTSANTGGTINKASIDLDPVASGQQLAYTDPGKGTYTADSVGLVTFVPLGSFTGTSTIPYNVADNYGMYGATAATIKVTVTSGSALALTVANPPGVCAPSTVNITATSVVTSFTTGASIDYYSTLAAATAGTPNINATATAINTSGIYYINAGLGGCHLIKPVTVTISQTPTTAVAGGAQSLCGPATNSALVANTPAVGEGMWSVVSGPAGGLTISIPMSSSTQVLSTLAGNYVLRWSITNGACPVSTSDLAYNVSSPGTTATSGGNHNLCNAATYTLGGNTATVGTGAWALTYKTAAVTPVIDTPGKATASVTGLIPGNTYVFRWTITNGACSTTAIDTVFDYAPPTTAVAGLPQVLTNADSVTLQGNTPTTGTGLWSKVSGPAVTIVSPASATTKVGGLTVGNNYTFRWTITNGACTSSSDVLISNVSTPLPLKLLAFSGSMRGADALLYWKVADQQSCDHYALERSTDSRQFNLIATIAPSGGTEAGYNYTDLQAAAGAEGRRYYRLREVETNGGNLYSEVLSLRSDNAGSGITGVQPNPFRDVLQIRISAAATGAGSMALYDVTGRRVAQQQVALSAGSNNVQLDGLAALAPGVYTLAVNIGDTVLRQRVVKQ